MARAPDSAPTYQLRDASVLAPFLARASGVVESMGRERIVAAWVESILAAQSPASGGPAAWLAESGMLDDLRDGSIARHLAAA